MPTIAQGSSVDLNVGSDATIFISNAGGDASVSRDGVVLWTGGAGGYQFNASVAGTYRISAVRGSLYYETSVDPAPTAALVVDQATSSAVANSPALNAIALAMLTLSQPTLLPPPAKIQPARITGTTRYVNFTAGGTNAGTLANPYRDAVGLAAGIAATIAGDGLLFAANTTTNIAAFIAPAVTGNAANRVIFGSYDPSTGERLIGVVGAATINSTDAFGAVFIMGAGRDFICVDGLRLTSTATNTFGVVDSNGGLSMQVTNCDISSAGAHGVKFYGNGHLIQGNIIRSNGKDGVNCLLNTGTNSDAVVQYNTVHSNTLNGFYIFDAGGSSGVYTGTAACNTFYDNGQAVAGRGAIALFAGASSAKFFRNRILRSPIGISFNGIGGAQRDFSGLIVENNDISFCEFGVYANAARGNWLIQYNRVLNSGSYTGATWVTASKYGRAIELYGLTAATAVSDGIVRNNFISGAYCWLNDGSEGVGLGLDNNTRNVDAHGNYVELCEGNGVQVNRGFGNRVFGNILVDNVIAPASRGTSFFYALPAQICYIGTPWVQVFNNHCIFTGRQLQTNQQLGVAEIQSVASPGATVRNNFIVGARVAGVARTQNAGGTTESNNVIVGSAVLVADCVTLLKVNEGAGTTVGQENDFDRRSPLFAPRVGGRLDRAGTAVPAGCPSFAGQDLGASTPIGALHASLL